MKHLRRFILEFGFAKRPFRFMRDISRKPHGYALVRILSLYPGKKKMLSG